MFTNYFKNRYEVRPYQRSPLCSQPNTYRGFWPDVTMRVCPSGCVCQAVRAPGSKVTLAPLTRAGSIRSNKGSILTAPVNQSSGPLADGCEPLFLISINSPLLVRDETTVYWKCYTHDQGRS